MTRRHGQSIDQSPFPQERPGHPWNTPLACLHPGRQGLSWVSPNDQAFSGQGPSRPHWPFAHGYQKFGTSGIEKKALFGASRKVAKEPRGVNRANQGMHPAAVRCAGDGGPSLLAPAVSPLLAHGLNSPLALFPRSGILFPLMAEKLDPKEIVTLEELSISNMWEMAALVEVLERKGILLKRKE